MNKELLVKDLTVHLNKKEIFSGAELLVQQGETVGLIGPNGAGKSTLLKIIAGINRNYQGQVVVKGSNLLSLSPELRRKHIAYLPQDIPIHPFLTPKNIFNIYTNTYSLNPLQLNLFVKRFKLDNLINCRLSELSGGEQRKIFLCAQFMLNTDILLLDEPTTYLDPVQKQELINVIKNDLSDKTILIVSHDLEFLHKLSNQLLYIKNKQLKPADPGISLDHVYRR